MPGMPAEMASQMKGITNRIETDQQCLTPEEAKRPKEDFFAGDNKNCRYDHFTMAGGKIDALMKCTDERRHAHHGNAGRLHARQLQHADEHEDGGRRGTGIGNDHADAGRRQTRRRMHRQGGCIMIGYVTVGSNDLEKARGFYDQLMPTIGAGADHGVRRQFHDVRHGHEPAGDRRLQAP